MTNQTKKINPAISVAKALLKSLLMVIAISVVSVIIIQKNPKLGTLLMFTGSCLMVLGTARKKFPLNTLTCVLPGAMVLSCFVLQVLLPIEANNALSVAGLTAGALVGLVLGRTHKIIKEKGRLIARRTWGYVLIWVLAFLGTQTTSLWGIEKIARVGLVFSGFSTAMMTILSLTLLIRYRRQISRLGPQMASSTKIAGIWLLIILSAFTTVAFAQTIRVRSAQEAATTLFTSRDMPVGYDDKDTGKKKVKSLLDNIKTEARREGYSPPLDFGCHIIQKGPLPVDFVQVSLFYFKEPSHARFYEKNLLDVDAAKKKFVKVPNCGDSCTLCILEKGMISEGLLVRGNWLVDLLYWRRRVFKEVRNSEQIAISDMERMIRLVDERLSRITYSGPGARQESQPGVRPESVVDFDEYISEELSMKAEDVGKAAAVIQLAFAVLMSTTMAASGAALQGVAGLHPGKDTTAPLTPPSPPTVSTQILDGQKALNWLQDRNMLDERGNLTEKFNTWFNWTPGATGTGPSGLEGFAGNINRLRPDGKEGPITGSKLDGPIAIIVHEPVPSRGPSPEPTTELISTPSPSPEPSPEIAPSPEPEPSPESSPDPTPSQPEIPIPSPEPDPDQSTTPPPIAGPFPKPGPSLKLTPAWLERNPLLAQNPNSMFTPDFMKNQVDVKFQGADSDVLSDTMYELAKNPRGKALDSVLRSIADIRGRPMDQIMSEYRKYQELQKQRDDNNPAATKDLYSCLHPRFMGSTSQLRSGQIVGAAFGVDPVFGAMLNPTGGLVGPGNRSIDADNSAVGYHGAMHDAAGYLYNSHKVGPGYDYLRKDQPRDTASPLSGQSEGIRLWREMLGERADIVSGVAEHGMRYIVAKLDQYEEAIRWGIDVIDYEINTSSMDKVNIF